MNGLTITVDGTIIVVRGFKAGARLKASGFKAIYGTSVGGWMLDAHRLPDLVAWLQYRNIPVTVIDAAHDGGDAA